MASRRTSLPPDASKRRTKQVPITEDYGENYNLRRSVSAKSTSPYNNIAEGYSRNDKTSPSHYLNPEPEMASAPINFPNWDSAVVVQKARSIFIEKPPNPHTGLGFSIRGGAEHGIGIYVSYIEANSVAERQGLEIGDQILSLNGVRFQRISHEEAAMMIRSAASLDMDVRSVGRVPGSIESLQTYSWVNPRGHMVSPPAELDRVGRYEASTGMSGKRPVMLLKEADERKINLMLHADARLGFMIRGGNEFGLGVYITGVDRHSLSESAGLKTGDQILDVNGHSFLDISHSEAVKILKSSRHLIMTVKDVGKIPHSRIMFDQTQWVRGEQMMSRSPESMSSCGNPRFVKGAGSQLMHSSTASNHKTQWGLINEKAQQVLNTEERELLVYYLKGYEGRQITMHALTLGMAELLDSPSKSDLIDEIRGLIKPQDLEVFDNMVQKKEGSPKQIHEDTDDVFRQERSGKRSHRQKRVQAMKTRSPSDDSGVDVNNGEHLQRFAPDQHHSGHMVQDALDNYSRTGQVAGASSATSPRQGHNGKRASNRRPHEMVNPPANYAKGTRRTSDEQEPWNDRVTKFDTYDRHQHGLNSDGYDDLEGLDYHIHPDRSEDGQQYSSQFGKGLSKHSKRQLMRGNSLESSHFYGAEVRFNIHEDQSQAMGNSEGYGHDYKSNSKGTASDYDTRPPRQGILKGSNGGSERISRHRRERVPHIKIQDWEEVEKDLPVPKGKSAQHNQHSPGSSETSGKPVTKRTQQKYRLTKEELEMLRMKVREKLAEVDRLKALRNSPPKDDNKQNNKSNAHIGSPRGGSTSLSKASKKSTTEGNVDSERNNGHSEITMRNQTVKFVDDGGSDAHLYGTNWDDTRAQILNKKGKPLEIPRHSDSDTSLNSLAMGSSERQDSMDGGVTLIDGEFRNGSSSNDSHPGIVKRQMRKITMHKKKPSLGLAIEGGGSTKQPLPRIVNIQENGCAYDCDLAQGQLILEVNGRCLRDLSHRECAQAIAEAFRDPYVEKVDFLIVDKSNSSSNRTDL